MPDRGTGRASPVYERRVEAPSAFKRWFEEYGLPASIRADNRAPFATNSRARLSKLSAGRVRLGILEHLIEPAGQETHISMYERLPRPMPLKIPAIEDSAHYGRRYMSANGGMRCGNRGVNVSVCCIGERVGLEEVDDGVWDMWFGCLKCGHLLEEHPRIED